MNTTQLSTLLTGLQNGTSSVNEVISQLRNFPAENVTDGCIDHQRELRTGMPEVIYGASKSAEQITTIAKSLLAQGGPVIATRVSPDKAAIVIETVDQLEYDSRAQLLIGQSRECSLKDYYGKVLIISAGTSDIPVAEEAHLTIKALGCPVQTLYDIGVAGLHRLLAHQSTIQEARVIIVVAGMEGALASVVSGLTHAPVVGVPTSVGYGASFGGVSALLAMLNSCAPGLSVVNIDNGFGAACMAHAINKRLET